MDMDDLWSMKDTIEREVATYEDAFGEVHQEELQPIPPPSMTEKGSSCVSRRMQQHCGLDRPQKNAEAVVADYFDTDRFSTTTGFRDKSQMRAASQVDTNREGVQSAAIHEAMLSDHNDLYNGYNLRNRLPRGGRHVPTRRETSDWVVAGNEMRRGVRRAMEGLSVPVLKAGSHDRDDHDRNGRQSTIQAAPHHSKVQLGNLDSVVTEAKGSKQNAFNDAAPLWSRGTIHRRVMPVNPHNESAKLGPMQQHASRSQHVPLSSVDAVEPSHESGQAQTMLQSARSGALPLSVRDSTQALDAERQSFNQTAALAATVAFRGEQIYTARAPTFERSQYRDMAMVTASRARDSGADSNENRRRVANDNLSMSMVRSHGANRPERSEWMSVLDSSVKLQSNHARAMVPSQRIGMFDAHAMGEHIRDGLRASVSAVQGLIGKIVQKPESEDASFQPPRRQTDSSVHTQIPAPTPAHNWTARESTSHPLVPTGPQNTSRSSTLRLSNTLETEARQHAGNYTAVNAMVPSWTSRSTRS